MTVPDLGSDEVHVWEIDLDAALSGESLSEDERERAGRFRFELHRRRFITGRSMLRSLLGAYLGRPPAEVVFSYAHAGKPEISELAFNLAHTEGLGLLAVSGRPRVGIDIETIRRMDEMPLVARAAFAPGEVKRWERLPPGQQVAAFHRCWTRKEAYLKATGEGIAQRLHSFEVAFEPGDEPRILSGAEGQWTLIDLSREPIYAAALAVAGPSARLRQFRATELLRKI